MYLMQTVSHPPVPRNKLITVMDPPIEAVKKQKTKWTLGSLFRRRTTNKQQQEAAESSSEEEADKKQHQRSFLSHRRSSRKRSERKAKEKSAKIKIEQQPWSGSANSLAGSSEGFGSHSSLSRRDRRELVKARVEATRRDSSSDDNDFTLHQSSSLTRFKSDDSLSSLNRRTRAARTERYMKRMEKSSESSEYHPANNATWNATVVSYRETSPFVRAVSATPSPVVSPKMAHRPLPPQMMSPPRSRRSYCCEQPPPFMPRNNPTPQLYASSAFLPFSPKQAPPPPPRDPQRRFMGTPQQYANVEAKPVYRSRSDHQLPQGDYANTSIFPSSSQTQFKYLADRTPRSRRPIHVIPVHEQSPECILPTPPAWLNEPPQPAKKQSTSPPIRRVSSIEVTLRTPSKTPPPPPVRRYSRQSSVSSVEDEMPKVHAKPVMVTASTNLEDALNELEEIYQSLQLGDEDLLDRAERRDLPTAFQLKRASSVDVSDDGIVLKRTSRAPPLRRSGIPDLVTDDMAYRRLKNPTTGPPAKDRTSGSYLLVSPALSPIPVQTLDPEEPNTTFDDMSYRAIKDANLMGNKVLDPQPPFGIPLTPAPPAANSDYLHAKPTDKYRSTFRPRKTPDLVNDDLAFRNLRKDNNKVGELKHKRAVRSLSANLMNLMEQRDEIEKTQSLGNLPESLQVLLEGSELRSSPGSRPPPSWVERAHLLDTSTETLTQSRANLRSLRNSFLSSDAESRPLSLFVPSNQISPIKEVETAVPANASTDYSEQFDEERLEELLSALAQEAQDTSEKLGKELERLRDGSHSVEDLTKSPTFYQDFDRSFASSLRHDPSQSAFRTPPGHRSPSIRNVFQVAEPCVEAMNSQIKASEKRRLMSVNLNGSPSKVDKSDSTSPSSSGLDNGEKSPTKRPQRKSAELSQIRTTRTSRLRAAAANASSPSSDSALSDNKPTARLKSTVPPVRKLLVDYPDSSSSSREGTPLGKNIAKLDETGDKSAKRKSVLNKANAEKLSSGESTTDDGSSRLKNRMAPSPKSSTTCRSLRPTSNQPSSSQNLRNASDPAKVESKKIIEVGKSELSKRADNLLARYKECDSRLDNLAARKASRNKAAPMAKKILHSATKENEKNIDKARAKDEVEEEEAPKKILAPNNSSEKSSAGNSAANSRQSPVKERKTSILKKKSMDDATGPVSILKHEVASSVQPSVSVKAPSPRPQSILKKKSSVDEPSCEERSGEEFEDEPQGILKRKSSTSNKGKMHTILKKKSSEELLPEDLVEPRPILKKRASTDDEVLSSNESEKPRPILKSGRRSAEGDESNYSSANSSPVRRSPSVKVEEGVIRNQVNLTLRFNQQADQEDGPFESACLSASEDENSRRGPSVSERAQLFMRLQEMHRLPSNDTPSTSKGFATSSGDDLPPMVTTRRERAKRFSTQPVTSEEVDEAKSQISVGPEPISIPTPATMTGDSDDEEEEPSSLSLAERVRLFTQKIEQQNRQPKEGQPVQKRTVKKQVTSTRFRTLPVTDAEVEGFSNTLGTRHQPSGLDGLVARAVMETSRSDPIDVDPRPRGILKHCSSMGSNSYPPLSTEPLIPPEETDIVRGILKIPASVIANALGSQQQSAFTSSFKSALKKESSTDERSNQSPTRSILKTGKAEEWTESSSEEEINSGEIKENLASLLNDVATQAEEERTILSSDTECDTSSSGGREVKNIISSAIEYRDTVATLTATASAVHQQQQGVAPEQEPKQRASSAEEASSWGPPPAAEPPKVVKKFEAAIKPTENGQGKKESDSVSKISIAERLALLKQNGETEWKKRVPRASPGDELASNGNKDAGYKPLQQSKSMPGSARGILAEKLNQLDVAASDWKKRVGPKDAVDFSVAGRMGVETGTPSPFMSPAREKRTPKPARFKSKKERNNRTSSKESDGGNSSTPESPSKEAAVTIKLPPLARSISAPESQPVIKVPSMTDHLDQFFTSTAETITMESEEIGTLPDAEQHTLLVSHRRTVQVQKRRNATRNPLKTLAARTDIVQEYQEVRTGAAEREMKRLNVEKLAKNSNLAVEALAGLASKEDFTAVSLKKPSGDPVGTLLPFRDLMLLQVKGRRHVQTRLVEPVASKVNQGDSYVLVTPNAVYNWLGKFSNVIERTRSAEIALQISQRKDLGCLKAAGNVFTIDEAKSLGSASHKKAFWKLLGVQEGCGEALKAGHPDEDEEYENVISETNKIWMVEDDELIPVEKYWGSVPKIEVLAPNKVLVFDFGSEVYIWNGKNATGDVRRFAAEFVQDELWQTVDYSDCDISPIGDTAVKVRPEWAILGKLSQHMETALFREKFLDWPEFSRVIRVKRKGETEVDGSIEVLPCDANKMAAQEWTEPDFELESSHIGRGEHYFDHETRRHFEIATTAVEVWHIEEFEYHEIPDASMGQFHEGDSYVVRWNYSITVSGRELSGAPSKHGTVGRDRCAYFFWQGSQSSLSEQGAAALLTVELDKEQGPQVRVVQGSELAVFRGLFNGHMAIHRGHRGQQQETSPKWRLFVTVTGAIDKESCLLEVAPSVRQLRSRSSLILLDTKSDKAFVWHGNQSHKHTKAAALRAARQMHLHPEFHLGKEAEIEEINEGDKQIEFFRGLGGNNTNLYDSLPPSNEPCDLKMFHFSSASGAFTVQEMLSATRTKEPAEAFPFVQRDLYELSQPALVLVDAGCVLWLWQGWWPREDGSGGDDSTGSGAIRWQAERRAAMQTAVNYWTATRGPDARLSANLVWAGLESVEFVSLFPDWQNKDDATESNMQDGRKPGETLSVEDELARLTQSTYPPAQLLQRPLPDGVDPTKLEEYLSSEHFEELLGMTKEEFTELPTWKQTSVKKQVGLF
ncbi:supervillin isoform X5 [Cloeon dipterum]|uniref:supervillin isoform X5 n=1 Tax=Cloeon dipterum TaxID=197152 RepID=UPI00322034AE